MGHEPAKLNAAEQRLEGFGAKMAERLLEPLAILVGSALAVLILSGPLLPLGNVTWRMLLTVLPGAGLVGVGWIWMQRSKRDKPSLPPEIAITALLVLGLAESLPLVFVQPLPYSFLFCCLWPAAAGFVLLSWRLVLGIVGSAAAALIPALLMLPPEDHWVAWIGLVGAVGVAVLGCASRRQLCMGLNELYAVDAIERAREIEQRERYESELVRTLLVSQQDAEVDMQARGETEGLWNWDLSTDKLWFSSHWKSMLGYGDEDLEHSPEAWFNLVHPHDLSGLMDALSDHLDGEAKTFESEHRVREKDGAYCWVLARGRVIRDIQGKALRLVGAQHNLRPLKEYESKLLKDATHDRLTGLPNRHHLMARLRQEAERASRHRDYRFAVAFLDLDDFKNVNESLGHSSGDRLLVEAARRLENVVEEEDILARLGGDEFVVLMRNLHSEADALRRSDTVLQSLQKPFRIGRTEAVCTASIGIALNAPGLRPEDLLRNADLAMYQAKTNKKGQAELFDDEMHVRTRRLWEMQNDLRRAVKRGELTVLYQPLISLGNGKISGAEALVRWRRPSSEVVSPAEFIPLAEEQGMIWEIGQWVLRESCRQARAWQDVGLRKIKISVNLSAKQLSHPEFSQELKTILQETKLDSRWLQVELTETALMGSLDATPASLHNLRYLGVQTAIDDFGTGYSSLEYLRRLQFDTLKIDRSFVNDIDEDDRAGALAASMIRMAHSLSLQVVAEGVETVDQMQFLKDNDCDQIQGYLVSPPVAADAFQKMLADELGLDEAVERKLVESTKVKPISADPNLRLTG